MVIVHTHCVRERTMHALVLGVDVGAVVEKQLDQTAVLEPESAVEIGVAIGVRRVHVGAFLDEILRIIFLVAQDSEEKRRSSTGGASARPPASG